MNPRVILAIARQEVRHAVRDRSFLGLSGLILLLFLVSCVVSSQAHKRAQEEMASLQEIVAQQWNEQPDRHPHRVAHYGYLAFRGRPALGFLDLGVSDFTGNSIFLEAHVQNSANFSEARQDSTLLRFGAMTPAFVAQVLMPLLVIFLVGRSVSRERERGTLAQVLSLGLGWRDLLLGKALGGLTIFSLSLGPAVAGMVLIAARFRDDWTGDTLVRLSFLGLLYLGYLTTWTLLSVLVSTHSRTSGRATVVLLSFWIVSTTFLPKALPSLGSHLHPAPSRPEFEHKLHLEVVQGGHGHNPEAEQFEEKKNALLKQYGVDSVEELPVNWRGIAMKEGEQASAEVYQKHYGHLQRVYGSQNRVTEWGAFLSPYLVIRRLSSAVCGTDFQAAVRFEQQAEDYRYRLIQKLNDLHIHEIGYEGDKSQRVASHHWDDFEPFRYTQPTLQEESGRLSLLFLALFGQLALLGALLMVTQGKVR